MTASLTPRTLSRIVAIVAVPAIVLALSVSSAQARPKGAHGHRHAHAHARCGAVRVAAPVYVARPYVVRPYLVAPTVVARHVVAPYRVAVPGPVVVPYAPVPAPYGAVVYDRGHVGVNGFIGITGPHVSIGIGF